MDGHVVVKRRDLFGKPVADFRSQLRRPTGQRVSDRVEQPLDFLIL
jgi:hypothetical protein